MDIELETFLSAVAVALDQGEPGGLDDLVAPWIDADEMGTAFDTHRAEVLSAFDYEEPPQVQATNLDEGDAPLDEVADTTELPEEVTDDNFRCQAYVQLIFEEDGDGLEAALDVWVTVVEVEGELRVGHAEFGEGD